MPDYQIVFKKLAEAMEESGLDDASVGSNLTPEEAQEIDELRQLALEIENPQAQSYTST